jgi:hypothetical protein
LFVAAAFVVRNQSAGLWWGTGKNKTTTTTTTTTRSKKERRDELREGRR